MSKELIERLRNTNYYRLDPYEAADRIEQLEADYDRVQLNVSAVYMEVTGGKCSKETTPASVVVGLYQEHLNKQLEALIRKAGDVMRERCACIRHDEKLEKAIRALPGVTLEDLK